MLLDLVLFADSLGDVYVPLDGLKLLVVLEWNPLTTRHLFDLLVTHTTHSPRLLLLEAGQVTAQDDACVITLLLQPLLRIVHGGSLAELLLF